VLLCYGKVLYMGLVSTCLLQGDTLIGVKGTCLLQGDTLIGVKKYLSVTSRHVIWGQKVLVCHKKARYMGSKSTCLLQEDTLYGVNKYLFVTRRRYSYY